MDLTGLRWLTGLSGWLRLAWLESRCSRIFARVRVARLRRVPFLSMCFFMAAYFFLASLSSIFSPE